MSSHTLTGQKNERSNTFKKKDSGIDKRNLRAHRRSQEWKLKREKTVNLRRGDIASPLSPLKEMNTNLEKQEEGPIKVIAKATKPVEPAKSKAQKASDERRAMLEKWRKEKELKKKLDGQQKKQGFKVAHVDNGLLSRRAFSGVAKVEAKPLPKPVKPQSPVLARVRKAVPKSPKVLASNDKRMTRSQALKANEPKSNNLKQVKPIAAKKEVKMVGNKTTGRVGAQTKPVTSRQPAANHTKPADVKKRPVNSKPAVPSQKARSTAVTKTASGLQLPVRTPGKVKDGINHCRGSRVSSSELSFAPTDFKFSAPSNLQSFVFNPLSPKSAAGFLQPGGDLSTLSPPSSKRCSTPLSQSKTLKSANTVASINSSDSGSDDKTESRPKRSSRKSRSSSVVERAEPIMSIGNLAQPKTTPDNPQPVTQQQTDANNLQELGNKDVEEKVEKSPVKVVSQKTPGRRKSLRKSHVSEPMPGKRGETQSLPDNELYGTKPDDIENQPPSDTVFKTPAPLTASKKRGRTRSLGTSLLLSNSAKKLKTPRNNRNSLILSTLSPEEGLVVLQNSPMIELTRRTPKQHKSPAQNPALEPLPSFDDIEEELAAAEQAAQANAEAANEAPKVTEEKDAETSQTQSVVANEAVVAMDTTASQEASKVVATEPESSSENTEAVSQGIYQESEHNVAYFRKTLETETNKLRDLCQKWEEYNNATQELTEEAQGQIRTAIGKAQLLMAQRFKQFTGLVDNCEFNTGEKETTCTDLEGFWEMVHFQVEDVHNMFAELDKKQSNGWQNDDKPKVLKKKIVKKKVNTAAAKPGGKSKFAEFRAKLKQQKSQNNEPVVESKTFVSGIFRIDSPLKKISPHCEGGSPGKLAGPGRLSNRGVTPCGSPLLKAVIKRNARKSRGPSPLVQETNNYTEISTISSEGKRKRSGSDDSDGTPAKLSCVEDCEASGPLPTVDGSSLFTPDASVSKQSKRRSLRRSVRKSVSWDKMEGSELKDSGICTGEAEQSSTNILAQYLRPSQTCESDMEVDSALSPPEDVDMSTVFKRALHSEFNKHSNSAKKANTPRRRSLRQLPTESMSAQRRGRRSVHFSGTSGDCESSPVAVKLPVTPFHKESSGRRRSTRLSVAEEGDDGLFSPLREMSKATASPLLQTAEENSPATRLAKLNVCGTPQNRRRSTRANRRVSGFTPPQKISPPVSALESVMETADLMSFSPSQNEKGSAETKNPRTPRRSLRPRVSLL